MAEIAPGSYVTDVKYHGFPIAQSSKVVKLTATKGFLQLDETMPVGTLLKLKFKQKGESDPMPVGPHVDAQVTHVEEASSKDKSASSGIEIAFMEGAGLDFLNQLLAGTWEEPEGGVAEPDLEEELPAQAAAPPPIPPEPPQDEPPQKEPQAEPPQEEAMAEASPEEPPPAEAELPQEPPPVAELPPMEVQPPEEEAYQKAGTIQGVPVMAPPDADSEEEEKKKKTKKRKKAKKARKKKGT